MKQLQISVPLETKETVQEILEDYSSEISVSDAEKNDKNIAQFTLTVKSEQIDELTDQLKSLKDIESGDLSISVLKQESLIKKGRATEGSGTMLSHEEVYSKAKESATFNIAEWALIGISAVIAAYGLVSNNIIVVIGAMMLSPILAPFVSGALSLNVGDKSLMMKALKTGLLSALISVSAATVALLPFSIQPNELIYLITSATMYSILLSLFVGVAAALTFVTGLRDQIAGVAVAIALIPPLASVGIGLRLLDFVIVLNSLTVAFMNMSAVILASFATFWALNFEPSTYYKQRQAHKIRYLVPVVLNVFCLLILFTAYDIDRYSEEDLVSEAEEYFGLKLVETNFEDNKAVIYVSEDVNSTEFENKVDGEFEVEIISLETSK